MPRGILCLLRVFFGDTSLVHLSTLNSSDKSLESAVSNCLVLYKTGGLPCGSLTTLIPPLRMVFLESRPSQGLPNFGITLQYEVVEGRGSCVLECTLFVSGRILPKFMMIYLHV